MPFIDSFEWLSHQLVRINRLNRTFVKAILFFKSHPWRRVLLRAVREADTAYVTDELIKLLLLCIRLVLLAHLPGSKSVWPLAHFFTEYFFNLVK